MDATNETKVNWTGSSVKILIPIPDHDFDPTEVTIPWKILTARGWNTIFSTEHGGVAQGDQNKLKGPLPGLLSASAEVRVAYEHMMNDPNFQHPIQYTDIHPAQYPAILLPGGDALRMRQYLENPILRDKVLHFWQADKLIGAICHGTLVLARTIDPQTQRSVLYGRKVTALPKWPDRLAFLFDKWFLKRGYIMYPKCVSDEVRASLERPEHLISGGGFMTPYVLQDGNLITARWYNDAKVFAERFAKALEEHLDSLH